MTKAEIISRLKEVRSTINLASIKNSELSGKLSMVNPELSLGYGCSASGMTYAETLIADLLKEIG